MLLQCYGANGNLDLHVLTSTDFLRPCTAGKQENARAKTEKKGRLLIAVKELVCFAVHTTYNVITFWTECILLHCSQCACRVSPV